MTSSEFLIFCIWLLCLCTSVTFWRSSKNPLHAPLLFFFKLCSSSLPFNERICSASENSVLDSYSASETELQTGCLGLYRLPVRLEYLPPEMHQSKVHGKHEPRCNPRPSAFPLTAMQRGQLYVYWYQHPDSLINHSPIMLSMCGSAALRNK